MCTCCGSSREDLHHLLFTCPRLRGLYAALGVEVNRLGSPTTFASFCNALRTSPPVANSLVLLVLWVVWKRRNRCVFDGVRPSNQQLAALLLDHIKSWVHRFPPLPLRLPFNPLVYVWV